MTKRINRKNLFKAMEKVFSRRDTSFENTVAYSLVDHSHCWREENPPCGLKGKHRCCICLKPVPK